MDFFTSYQMKYLLAIQQMIPMIIKCLALILFFLFKFEARFEKLDNTRQACMVDWPHTYVVARRCSAKILFSKFCKFLTKKLVSEFPFDKVRGLQLITLIKQIQILVFSFEFCETFQFTFVKNISKATASNSTVMRKRSDCLCIYLICIYTKHRTLMILRKNLDFSEWLWRV